MTSKKTNTSFFYLTVLAVLLALGLALFFRSSAFVVQNITVQGLSAIPKNEILKLASGAKGQNLLLFDQEDLKNKIFMHPLVQDVKFKRILPHTLVIQITERTPVALVVISKGVLEVDSQGIFLRRLESWPKTDYPVITGVAVADTIGPGQSLNNPSLTAALRLLGQAPKELLSQIGELHVNTIQQMTLYLTSGVEVRLGQAQEWKDKLNALWQLINDKEYKSFQQGVRYIDFTAAKPVIGR
ncbi:cell division septal protein [Desulfosporosinus acidiphilus SJ4]|uniref:Cell division septal protein n=1 Tax=Desulfosporosinus acidiphilus (strain DSM 22704 / JCM 16185 / SJ4) TaxID=646529 RepID=I4DA10_DESAJ|nr:cell division protein FtsQ/DivIB [Desulfosporosinus acidiphilus]AFM42634.1 cell division septal protein [Desulfosporosinus acidiphilus SJ4]